MFISFEGIDGSGKTTQAVRLAERLRAEGRQVASVREPGGTRLGEQIRTLLLDPSGDVTPRAELLLFSAARAQLVERVIMPALSVGKMVIADRFFDSTTAYQGFGRGVLAPEEADAFHALVTGGLTPDLTLIVDVTLETARRRRMASTADRMEAADDGFYSKVREGYHAMARRYPERIVVVDGETDKSRLGQAIYAIVEARM